MIIGVVGKARSGKDTFAELLAEAIFDKTKHRFVLMAYAQELKLRVQRDFDLSYDQLWGDQKEVEDKRYRKAHINNMIADLRDSSEIESEYWTPREILQEYGEFYRSIDINYWVKNLFRIVDEKEYKDVIVTDVRHPNEANPIKERDGYIIKVSRESKDKIHGENHISEVAMDNYEDVDFEVLNNEGLEELKNTAYDVVNMLLFSEKSKSEG